MCGQENNVPSPWLLPQLPYGSSSTWAHPDACDVH